jgi:hypothetical protein
MPNRERAEPRRAKLLSASEDPIGTQQNIELDEPMRENDRRESEDPKCRKSSTDRASIPSPDPKVARP